MAGTIKEFELANPDDAISCLKFDPSPPSGGGDLLLSAGWDKSARLYRIADQQPPLEPVAVFHHPSPVLDLSFGTGRNQGRAYTGSLDHGIREIDLETASTLAPADAQRRPNRVIATHLEAVQCVHYSSHRDVLITGSWDCSIILQDPKVASSKPSRQYITSLTLPNLPSKVRCLDTSQDKLVVAMGNRKTWIWDLRKLSETVKEVNDEPIMPPPPLQERESSLKFMIRSIKCMPDGSGYASSSIEGRVAVEFFDPSPEVQAKKYAFKCHRQTIDGVDTVYPVHSLAFHPKHGTFASGGGDGIVSIWDSNAKKRLRQLPKYPGSISSLAFNPDGSKLAIACSVYEEEGMTLPKKVLPSPLPEVEDRKPADGERGAGDEGKKPPTNTGRNVIFIRNVNDDCKPKGK